MNAEREQHADRFAAFWSTAKGRDWRLGASVKADERMVNPRLAILCSILIPVPSSPPSPFCSDRYIMSPAQQSVRTVDVDPFFDNAKIDLPGGKPGKVPYRVGNTYKKVQGL